MNACCDNHSFHSHNSRIDPTKTTSLRKRFEADFTRRFRMLAREIRETVVKEDGFGALKTQRRFDFPTNQGKVSAFMSWLKSRQDVHLFEGKIAAPREVAANSIWMNTYIDTAYRRGIRQSISELRSAGGKVSEEYVTAGFLRPVHADRAGIIYTRAYDGLRGITEKMDDQISKILAEGIANGKNPLALAKSISDRVEKIGLTRARLLARTEVIAAHAEAKLNTYEDAGLRVVGLKSEWLTAGDEKVCDECDAASKEGPYETAQAHGMIPLHPNCRCTWVPLIPAEAEINLR